MHNIEKYPYVSPPSTRSPCLMKFHHIENVINSLGHLIIETVEGKFGEKKRLTRKTAAFLVNYCGRFARET